MQTRSSLRLTRDQSSNPTSSTNTNPKGHNRRSSKQRVKDSNLEEQSHPVVTMADNRTMAEMLRAPTEGYKDLLRACPYHGFTKLHQSDTFYNALNPAYQDSLNAAAGGNFLERINQQISAMTTAMTAMLKQFQATQPPALVKAVEEICVTCGGAHPYYQCLAAGGHTFP
nr:reverse transcriptase domain-containing protein [Tanacetum cinerariifolium]